MIKNTEGKVYLRYYQPAPKYVKIGEKEYVTDVRHSVSMLLVPEEEVPALLSHLGGCCGKKRHIFTLASEGAVRVWETGQR